MKRIYGIIDIRERLYFKNGEKTDIISIDVNENSDIIKEFEKSLSLSIESITNISDNLYLLKFSEEEEKTVRHSEYFVHFNYIDSLYKINKEYITVLNNYYKTKDILITREKINDIECIITKPKKKTKKVVICIHGLAGNNRIIHRFYPNLVSNNYAVISFDLPSHGKDKTDMKEFGIKSCLEYLSKIVEYVKCTYSNNITFITNSFGGYVLLSYLSTSRTKYKSMIMCPAINFGGMLNEKAGNDYFSNNEYISIFGIINIYKESYNEFVKYDKIIENSNYKNVSMFQGTSDEVVSFLYNKDFALRKKIEFIEISGGKHELYSYEQMIIDKIIGDAING